MLYTFENPGTWTLGVQVTKGDIFLDRIQVPDPNKKNSNISDREYPAIPENKFYYQAKSSFTCDKNNMLPTEHGSNDYWWSVAYGDYHISQEPSIYEEWAKISNLAVGTSTGDDIAATIYSNGLQMAAVYVTFTAEDKDGNHLTGIDDDHIKKSVYLVNYDTGRDLQFDNPPSPHNLTQKNGWFFCREENDYLSNTENKKDSPTSGKYTTILYILCNDKNNASAINLGVRIVPPARDDQHKDGYVDWAGGEATFLKRVSIKTKASPGVSKDILEMTAGNIDHSGQLKDDGSDFLENTQTAGNLWRQYNFYLKFTATSQRKIKDMIMHYAVGDENSSTNDDGVAGDPTTTEYLKTYDNSRYVFVDCIKDGYHTKAYLWKKDQPSVKAFVLEDNRQDIMASSDTGDSICVTYLTSVSAMFNKFQGSYTSPVYATVYDTNGNSFDFTPVHTIPREYQGIADIRAFPGLNESLRLCKSAVV